MIVASDADTDMESESEAGAVESGFPHQQKTTKKERNFEPSPGGAFRKIEQQQQHSPTVAPSHYLVPVESKESGSAFVLGPTPAQKKNSQDPKSPRSSSSSSSSSSKKAEEVLQRVNFREKFSSLPEFRPGESPGKLPSLPSSPQLFVASYRKKRKASDVDNLGSDADTPSKSATPKVSPGGNTFFGPDFNPDSVVTPTNGHHAAAPAAPEAAGPLASPKDSPSCLTPGGTAKAASSLRKTLDTRRQLVMQLFQSHGLFPSNQDTSAFQSRHADAFPTKVCLQLKIREVRQKMMAQSEPGTPATPTAATPAAAAKGIALKVQDN